ncbi:hypothetical protein [Kitasatospora paranensis]|uniref:phosphorylase family protein n=1 Tax=Kitasatospora paranensis TaxID=258053 RepID=UPI0031E710D9
MQLIGTVSPDRPLLVVAVREEAAHLDRRLPVLLTGMGKINAAAGLATVLAQGVRPSEVVNLGTAGALRPGLAGTTHRIAKVIQHDIDTPVLRELTGRSYGDAIDLGEGTARCSPPATCSSRTRWPGSGWRSPRTWSTWRAMRSPPWRAGPVCPSAW